MIVTLDLVPEQQVAAGCPHATKNIRLKVYKAEGVDSSSTTLVDNANAFGRGQPSANVHLTDAGWYKLVLYSFADEDYDYNLHAYTTTEAAAFYNTLGQGDVVSIEERIPAVDLVA
jgi:hypothetical protein